MRISIAVVAGLLAVVASGRATAQEIIVNQPANSIGWDALTNQIYASVPFSAATNPNSLQPIDVTSGALGTNIPIGTRLGAIAVSSDSSFVYVVDNDGHGVQRYNVTNNSLDQNFNMPGSGEYFQSVRQIYAVPGQPDALLVERGLPDFSPPAVATGVWVNGTELPNTVGYELGIGGPDILAIDPSGQTAYGFQNSVSSYSTWAMTVNSSGVSETQEVNYGPFGQGIGLIQEAGGLLYANNGGVYNVNNSFAQVGSFTTVGDFVINASDNRLFSMDQVGSNDVILVYNLTTLQELGTIATTGIGTVATSDLIRFGVNGLAFTTTNNQVVMLQSQLVPEPPSLVMALVGAGALAFWGSARHRGPLGLFPLSALASRLWPLASNLSPLASAFIAAAPPRRTNNPSAVGWRS